MRQTTRCKMVFSTFLTMLVLAGAATAQEKKPAGKPLERKTLDESIYQSLRGIIDHGADLYNQGDWNGCYRLWEGALLSLKPMLDHRPKLQEAIDGGLSKARQEAVLWQRAWALRPVLDKIRADINADYPHKRKQQAGEPPLAKDETKPKTLWERLGGEPGVTKVVEDFVTLALSDPKIDFLRGGRFKPTAEQIARMKREIIEQISQASGGPLKYTGPDMKSIHKGMGITEAQFNAAAADFKKALEMNKVAADDVKKILDAVGSYRKAIVEPKKTDEKKQEDKKPAEKKEEKKNGKKADDTARIEGKITYQGKPLAGGVISLVGSNGFAFSGTIDANGAYLLRVKPGEYKVAIDTKANAKIPQVPAKYSDSDKSGLTVNVREGGQTFDIALR